MTRRAAKAKVYYYTFNNILNEKDIKEAFRYIHQIQRHGYRSKPLIDRIWHDRADRARESAVCENRIQLLRNPRQRQALSVSRLGTN